MKVHCVSRLIELYFIRSVSMMETATKSMNKPKKDLKLQRLIDRCVLYGGPYVRAQHALNDYCQEKYGCEPGDVDADEIIDKVFLGSGEPSGMDADDFDSIMNAHKKGD